MYRLVDYRPDHRAAFAALNRAWIEQHFGMEPEDEHALQHPEEHYLAPGGQIVMAESVPDGEPIGTGALIPHGDELEVSKMAVAPAWQGRGVGRAILAELIRRFEVSGARELFLETNSVLRPAIALYESMGFAHVGTRRAGSPYARADVYMVWRPGPVR